MSDERYNGWANRETWAVALHVNNDQGWQEAVLETVRNAVEGLLQDPPPWVVDHTGTASREAQNRVAGDAVRESVEEALTLASTSFIMRYGHKNAGSGSVTDYVERVLPVVQDIGSLWRVDWTELGASFIEVLDEGVSD